MFMDEVYSSGIVTPLTDQSIPSTVHMIIIMNPVTSDSPLILPSTFHHITLTTPYRSTIAITSLARCIAKQKGLFVSDGDFGSDVQGKLPIFFDVGRDQEEMEQALDYCRQHLGDNVTLLYDDLPESHMKIVKDQGKTRVCPWECYDAFLFHGWEADRVVVVTNGRFILEAITRARNIGQHF